MSPRTRASLAGTVTKPTVLLLKVSGQIRVGNFVRHHLQQKYIYTFYINQLPCIIKPIRYGAEPSQMIQTFTCVCWFLHHIEKIPRSAHTVFMCFVWISEQTAIISLYSINWLVCITETECVYCGYGLGLYI